MRRPIFIIINIIIVLLVAVLVSWPKYQIIRLQTEEIGKKNLELQYKKEYFDDLRETWQRLQGFQEELAKVDTALPSGSSESLVLLFDSLQAISSQTGLLLDFPELPSSSGQDGQMEEIPLSLSLSGSFSSFKNFLDKLEKSSRLFEIESISVLPPGDSKTPLFKFNLLAKIRSWDDNTANEENPLTGQ